MRSAQAPGFIRGEGGQQCNIEIAWTKAAGWCWRCWTHDVNGFNLPGNADAEVAAAAHKRAWREVGRA